MKRRRLWLFAPLLVAGAFAQEPLFSEAATHPGRGALYSRFVFTSPTLKNGGSDERWEFKTAHGFSAQLALLLDLAFDRDGVEKAGTRLKQQVFRHDSGPINTWRVSAQGGVQWRDGEGSHPRVGLVSTTIQGRHGFNVALDADASAPSPDRFEANASYLYRLAPKRYQADTTHAWYAVFESLNRFSRDGDRVSDLGLSLLYEARRHALELGVRFEDPENALSRASVRVGAGMRLLW